MSVKKVSVVFVCMGNICRSPTAEAVMKRLVEKRGLQGIIHVDSAGTIDYHAGEACDRRSSEAARSRGYEIDHLARQIQRRDLDHFDYVVAMDRKNLRDMIRELRPTDAQKKKLSLLLEHAFDCSHHEVPDPYYGGPQGFEHVIDLVEKGCNGLIDRIVLEHHLEQ